LNSEAHLTGSSTLQRLLQAARQLSAAVDRLDFLAPVSHVYNPLRYAWDPYESYLRVYGTSPKRVIFLGMNPGPFGMVQTGIPFGEVAAVRDWLKVKGEVTPPKSQHPRRPILGFDCPRSEVSGRRLWGFFAERFGTPRSFFAEHLVLNYCPLAFLEISGRNRTPDKLPLSERNALYAACDEHLRAAVAALTPEWVVAIGDFARKRAEAALTAGHEVRLGQILHPSPANPSANRAWASTAERQLIELGVWRD
jgi:single-strand selective monofunctional uracil DNA glycosylase